MSSTRPRRLALAAAAAAAALALAACAPGGQPDDTATDAPTAERLYIEAISADPTSMNPQFAGGPIPLRFGFAVLGTLVEVTDSYEILPGLAESWEFSPDGLTITFKIRQGVTWHDGEPFTVDDVIFNFEEIMPLQTFGKALTSAIDSIEAPDDSTVVLTMNSQYGPFLEALSQQAITPKHIYEGTDYVTNPANLAPIGTGPMMFESFEPGAQVVLVKNPDWWGGDVQVDRAIYPVMTDVNTRTLAMLAGELDSAIIDPAQQDQVTANPDLELLDGGVFRQGITVTFNSLLPELESADVRALIFAAIDREAVTQRALSGIGEAANSFFPDTLAWAQSPDVNFEKDFPRDLDAINAGLDAAGYPVQSDGWRFSLDLRFISALSDVGAAGEVVKSSLADVGINVNLVGTAEPVWMEEVYQNSNFGISMIRSTVSADPSLGISRWMISNPDRIPVTNGSGISDAELDAAAQGALSTLDRDERATYFHTMQERARDLIYYAPLSWSNGSNYTVNTTRWENLNATDGQTNNPPWATMSWIGG
ncbi:MAG TPA: ABC transporter substrate-binding protein [Microbacteriaceae bacterium]|nr:ABC transporter substrate-binding protein [Microbacteriaceae bacterium]